MGILRGKIGSVLLLGAFCVLFAWGMCGDVMASNVAVDLCVGNKLIIERDQLKEENKVLTWERRNSSL